MKRGLRELRQPACILKGVLEALLMEGPPHAEVKLRSEVGAGNYPAVAEDQRVEEVPVEACKNLKVHHLAFDSEDAVPMR